MSCADILTVQGNILIDEDGVARLGDFGIAAVISDPTIVEQSGTTTSASGVVRYKAPELLYPLQFNLKNSNPTKESDIYSFAMVSYEVCSLCTRPVRRRRQVASVIRFLRILYRMGTLLTVSLSSTSWKAIDLPALRKPDGYGTRHGT